MKKTLILSLGAVMLISGCGTYAGEGAFVGASFGSVIGSAVGGISGGFRGSDIGTLVGMAGGAVVGGAIGAQADKEREQKIAASNQDFEYRYRQHREAATRGNSYNTNGNYDSGAQGDDVITFDPSGSGDDTLYDFQSSDYTGDYTASEPRHETPSVPYDRIAFKSKDKVQLLEIRNARFVDDNEDGHINPGEISKVIFEVYNISGQSVYDVQPLVTETTGNKRIAVSGTIHVERILPGKGVRYTAMVQAAKRIKGNEAVFRVCAAVGSKQDVSNVLVFSLPIAK
ncbi:MAG: hypothetical protein ACI4V5_08265 [Prevotella sp.]